MGLFELSLSVRGSVVQETATHHTETNLNIFIEYISVLNTYLVSVAQWPLT
jgi:hypothetical protein